MFMFSKNMYIVPVALPADLLLGADLWGLLPSSLQSKLAASYPGLQEITDRLSTRLSTLLTTDLVDDLWTRYADQLPSLGDLVALLADDIKGIDVGDSDAAAWLVGGPACAGNMASRARSTNKQ